MKLLKSNGRVSDEKFSESALVFDEKGSPQTDRKLLIRSHVLSLSQKNISLEPQQTVLSSSLRGHLTEIISCAVATPLTRVNNNYYI